MGTSRIRRLMAVLATIALLLTGAAPAEAGEPCDQTAVTVSMAGHGATPCDHDGKAPDRPMGAACAPACFAQCPAPMPSLGPPDLAWSAFPVVLSASPEARHPGIGVPPLLHPPRI